MLTLLLGTDWKCNRRIIMQMLAEDVAAEKAGCILMVPELTSHQAERELARFAGDTASRFAEVLSFTRLAKRVAEETGHKNLECLDNGGRVVAMAAAARQLHSKLKAYAAVETRPEFLTGMLDAVDEFKRCCITSRDLMEASAQTQGNLAQKLEELALLLEAYDSICAGGKRDPRDQMTWLLEQLEDGDFAEKHSFYFDAFPDYSRQHMDILCHLILHSPEVVVSLNCDMPGSNAMAFEKSGETAADIIAFAKRNNVQIKTVYAESECTPLNIVANSLFQGDIKEATASSCLRVCSTDSVYSECACVTEQIVGLVQQGCRYRDISVVCTDIAAYKGPIRSLFERAHIPLYLSGTEDILDKTVIHTVLAALDAAIGGFAQKDVFRYLRSALSPVGMELCDRIENYAILWSIDGNSWLQDWQRNPRGLVDGWTERDREKLNELNRGRIKALQPLERLHTGFKNAIGIQQQVKALYAFLEEIHLEKCLQDLAQQMDEQGDNRNAQMLSQLWEILLGALEQLYDVLGDTSWDADTFVRLLKLLLSQYDVGTIPTVLDAVTVGPVSAMRCQKSRHLFILGASEGVFPSYGSSAGVLNDQERSVLQKLGVAINPGAIDGLQTQFSEIQEVFSGATDSVTVFCSDGQPSYIYSRLKKMAGTEEDIVPALGAALTDTKEAAAYLVRNNGKKEAAELNVSELYDAVNNCKDHTLGAVDQAHIQQLYGSKLQLSASQIDKLADCRLFYFLRYGLRAQERKPASIDPAEFGTYVHAVLEECGRAVVELGGFKNVSLEKTLEVAADISARYFAERFSQMQTERLSYHFNKNTREVEMIVRELWDEMQQSQFQPADFELGFGDEMDMPAVPITGKTLQAQLRGFVDRVDIWEHNGRSYIRVVDYKTGKKDFDYCDVFNGIGLQMLLYLFALEDGGQELYGDQISVAGVQYFPARVPIVAADGSVTAEEASRLHAADFRRKGLLLSDDEVLHAMEPSESFTRLCCKKNKDGSISGDIASKQQFVELKKYVFKLLEKIVDEIASGNVTPNPYTRGASHNACAYCPYGAVCHPEQVEGRRNYQKMTADRFWEEIRKELDENG